MKIHLSNTFVLVFAILFFTGCNSERTHQKTETAGRTLEYVGTLDFLAPDGGLLTTIEIAIADDEPSRSAGLMDVRDLPENKGMLFLFDDEQPRSFWMASTPLSLDIIFVNSNREIVRIHRNTQPYSQQNFQSEVPAKYVVEVNAGFTTRYDITEGVLVDFKL
ncbi:MAG: DUF192 domain-containing protein [Balneolaceae bacterium]